MRFFSTNHREKGVSLREAIFKGFAEGGALYVPESFPTLDLSTMQNLSLKEVCYRAAEALWSEELSKHEIADLVEEAASFPIPLVRLDENKTILELFHGPTLSFKDFGARFLAGLIKRLRRGNEEVIVLVATSGDTGSAVGNAFLGMPGVRVYILYPEGRVTPTQERQLTTLGGNVTALTVEGTFDACQSLVRMAVQDPLLKKRERGVTTGNSINVGRVLAQSFYYVYATLQDPGARVFSVPSGNFGHLVSGLIAKKMGAPIERVLAATNINDEVPLFLRTGIYMPHVSYKTVAVSMDVGSPSNFRRFLELYEGRLDKIRADVAGFSYEDDAIRSAIRHVKEHHNYLLDPHTAVSYLALRDYQREHPGEGIVLATAHPAKFLETVQPLVSEAIAFPPALQALEQRSTHSTRISPSYEAFRDLLLETNN